MLPDTSLPKMVLALDMPPDCHDTACDGNGNVVLEAVIKGGVFGVGLGQADTKLTGLPFAPTDSIFAVVAEELGLSVYTIETHLKHIFKKLNVTTRGAAVRFAVDNDLD
jgi:hypothetical protein